MEDQFVMYFVANKDLNMSGPKLAVQVAHAVEQILHSYYKIVSKFNLRRLSEEENRLYEAFYEWFRTDYRKVILGSNQKEFNRIKEEVQPNFVVVDKGFTELAPNTETVIGFYPMKKSEVPKLIKRLQLLK